MTEEMPSPADERVVVGTARCPDEGIVVEAGQLLQPVQQCRALGSSLRHHAARSVTTFQDEEDILGEWAVAGRHHSHFQQVFPGDGLGLAIGEFPMNSGIANLDGQLVHSLYQFSNQ